jgi:hypothetical protein
LKTWLPFLAANILPDVAISLFISGKIMSQPFAPAARGRLNENRQTCCRFGPVIFGLAFGTPWGAFGSSAPWDAESGRFGSHWAVSTSSSPACLAMIIGITRGRTNNKNHSIRFGTCKVTLSTNGSDSHFRHVLVGSGA